jgi:hypothetical protein
MTIEETEVVVDEESSSDVPLEASDVVLEPGGFKMVHEDRSIKDKTNIENVFLFIFGTSLSVQV